jgi:hypothetical protein
VDHAPGDTLVSPATLTFSEFRKREVAQILQGKKLRGYCPSNTRRLCKPPILKELGFVNLPLFEH